MVINVLMIESVGICNGTCVYCPQGTGLLSKLDDDSKFITFDILEKSLNLAKKGNQKAIYLHHRGEPLLHPEIGNVIRNVRKAGFLAYLSTNMISATEEKLEEILTSGINQVEVHYSGGRTRLSHNALLIKIHKLNKLNWEIRNHACKIEVNYGLQENETEESVRNKMANSSYYDENMYIRFYRPHDWPGLVVKRKDYGIDPTDCEWYKTQACAVLSNGDVVICCLDQKADSTLANVMDMEEIRLEHLNKRDLCKSCIQYNWDMDWLRKEALEIPNYMKRRLNIDPWKN